MENIAIKLANMLKEPYKLDGGYVPFHKAHRRNREHRGLQAWVFGFK